MGKNERGSRTISTLKSSPLTSLSFSYNGGPNDTPRGRATKPPDPPRDRSGVVPPGRCKVEMRCFTTGAISSSRPKLQLAKLLALKNLSARREPATVAPRCLNRSDQRAPRDLKELASPLAVASPYAHGSALWVNQ